LPVEENLAAVFDAAFSKCVVSLITGHEKAFHQNFDVCGIYNAPHDSPHDADCKPIDGRAGVLRTGSAESLVRWPITRAAPLAPLKAAGSNVFLAADQDPIVSCGWASRTAVMFRYDRRNR
jgi:hypothetical protein